MADNKEEKLEEATAETEETKPAEEKQEAAEETAETASADEKSEAKEEGGDDSEETSIVEDVVSAVASTVETVAETVAEGASALVDAVTGNDENDKSSGGKRNEKVGVVYSDKMQKTVVVRVDRTVKHPLYHKYMKRRKKFMAHDELGATEGDRVRIVETRPMSARKRWRVVEIIQKAEK